MKERKKNYEKIDDYILGHLESSEVLAFEEQLKTDSSLSEAVASHRRLHKGMVIAGRKDLKTQLKNIHKEVITNYPNTPVKKPAVVKQFNWRPLLAIASMFLVGLFAWWMMAVSGNDSAAIFESQYQAYNLKLGLRNENPDPRIGQAMQFYHQQQYKETIPLFEELIEENGDRGQERLGLAIARFESGDITNAFSPLSEIINSNHPFLSDQAKWYSALFYLKENQEEKAVLFLNELAADPKADHHQTAKEILKQLK